MEKVPHPGGSSPGRAGGNWGLAVGFHDEFDDFAHHVLIFLVFYIYIA